jgi:urease accessory protein UreF
MIAGNAQLQEFVLAQLQHHIIQYPAAVAHRIFETLLRFDLSTVPQLKALLPNAPTTTLQKTVPNQ